MKYIIILTFVLVGIEATGQNLFPTQFNNCNTDKFFLEGKEIFSKCDLNSYLNQIISKIDAETLSKIKGQITFQIIIDKSGNPCCQSLKNELNGKGKKVDFKKLVDSIDFWEIPIKEEKEETVSAIIKIVFGKERIEIQRLGFNAKVGLISLDHSEKLK